MRTKREVFFRRRALIPHSERYQTVGGDRSTLETVHGQRGRRYRNPIGRKGIQHPTIRGIIATRVCILGRIIGERAQRFFEEQGSRGDVSHPDIRIGHKNNRNMGSTKFGDTRRQGIGSMLWDVMGCDVMWCDAM